MSPPPRSRKSIARLSEEFLSDYVDICCTCNGYYGPCFGEPVCSTCHAFLFAHHEDEASAGNAGNQNQFLSAVDQPDDQDDTDSGNDEPVEFAANAAAAQPPPPPPDEEDEEAPLELLAGAAAAEVAAEVAEGPGAGAVRVEPLIRRLALLSPNDDHNYDNEIRHFLYFDSLPPEVLMLIFSYLDDISLYSAGHVNRRWQELLRSQVSQRQWKLFTARRWPLFRPIAHINDWFGLYSTLIESSYCLSCLYQSAEDDRPVGNHSIPPLRKKRLGHDLRNLIQDPLEGIRAQPLDSKYYHWQASITGPVGSPYEGGIFFLYLKVPFTYPWDPPQVRFLSKIFHPNVSKHGDVGIDLIQDYNWSSSLTIPKVLLSIQSLLTDPYCDICMEPNIARLYLMDKRTFDAIARLWTWKFAIHDAIHFSC